MVFNQKTLKVDERNRLRTKNQMGFAHLTPLKITQDFYTQAETQKGMYADIGSAYGIDTIHIVKLGARVVAIDLEQQHLDILQQQLSPQEQQRLETRCQRFPEAVSLELAHYDAILLSRLLLFLTPDSVVEALKKVYKALKVGGKVYIITVSPFSESWELIKPAFEEHQKLFPTQPFFVSNLWKILPQTRLFLPQSIQLFDQKALKNVLEQTGFEVIDCGYESHHGTVDTYAVGQKNTP